MHRIVFALAAISFLMTGGAALAAGWPPADPGDYTTKTDFTIAWAKKLRGFQTLADLQQAAGSKGVISDRKHELDSDHPRILTDENVSIIVNNFGSFICDKCDPPIEIIGAEPSWSK
jgi:hypothetical protein